MGNWHSSGRLFWIMREHPYFLVTLSHYTKQSFVCVSYYWELRLKAEHLCEWALCNRMPHRLVWNHCIVSNLLVVFTGSSSNVDVAICTYFFNFDFKSASFLENKAQYRTMREYLFGSNRSYPYLSSMCSLWTVGSKVKVFHSIWPKLCSAWKCVVLSSATIF